MSNLNIYRGKRVLVTGCTGFKGTWLSLWLHELGAAVSGLAIGMPTAPAMFDVIGAREFVDYREGDVRDSVFVSRTMAEIKPDVVFHLAAQSIVATSYAEPALTFDTNVMGTAHVLDALRSADHPVSAVMITSDKCYENVEWLYGYREIDTLGGKDPYSASKAAAEMAVRAWHQSFFSSADSAVRLCSVRAGNVIGGGDWASARIVPDCMRAWSEGTPVRVRRPQSTRPWQHVLEPLSGYLTAGAALMTSSRCSGEAYNFGPPAENNFSVRELIRELAPHWGFAGESDYAVFDQVDGFAEAGLLKLNCDKALAQLSWRPTLTFGETARLTSAWYERHYHASGTDMRKLTSEQIADYLALATSRSAAWL
ncbi:MAG: CDP-glucose 4,6-dehydratase [Lysobacterales bacterium]